MRTWRLYPTFLLPYSWKRETRGGNLLVLNYAGSVVIGVQIKNRKIVLVLSVHFARDAAFGVSLPAECQSVRCHIYVRIFFSSLIYPKTCYLVLVYPLLSYIIIELLVSRTYILLRP